MAINNTTLADKVKIWLFPSLVGIVGALIWSDLQTIKSNLSIAITQTITDKTNIENLNGRVSRLENVTFKLSAVNKTSIPTDTDKTKHVFFTSIVATKPEENPVLIKNNHHHTTL